MKNKCPICNKLVKELRNYKDGSKLYVHTSKTGLFGCQEMTGCHVSAPRVRTIYPGNVQTDPASLAPNGTGTF
jgi:hypothetical protein